MMEHLVKKNNNPTKGDQEVLFNVSHFGASPPIDSDDGIANAGTHQAKIKILPFALLNDRKSIQNDLELIFRDHGLSSEMIEDAYPCTPLQAGLVALARKNQEKFIFHSIISLNSDVDIKRFQKAWERTLETVPILRTRIVPHKSGSLLQVVVHEPPVWRKYESITSFLNDGVIPIDSSQPLIRYSLIYNEEGTSHFALAIHHALYDEVSNSLVHQVLETIYQGKIPAVEKYNLFISHIQDQKKTPTGSFFWREELSGFSSPGFPSLPLSQNHLSPKSKMETLLRLKDAKTPGIKISTIIHGAWAMVVSSRAGSSDVVFGTTVSGRNTPIPGIESILGPTIATVPIRVQIRGNEKISDYLNQIQKKMTALIPFQQIGLQEIADISPEAKQACEFQSLLVVKPPIDSENVRTIFGSLVGSSRNESFRNHALTLECFLPQDDTIRLAASYDSSVLDQKTVESTLRQFKAVIKSIANANPAEILSSLCTISPRDEQQIWTWNKNLPIRIQQCFHDMVDQMVRSQGDAVAIHAWDGKMTYQQLGSLSTQLCYTLLAKKVLPGEVVLLCFEKSVWTTVAMLAASKAGCVICMIEPSYPKSRLRSIVEQTGARVILSSVMHLKLSSSLAERAISVGDELLSCTNSVQRNFSIPQTDPSSIMYVVFTSGSTGVPKGVLVQHSAFCSGIHYQAHRQGINTSSRVLDFTTHAFDVFIYNTGATLSTGACLCVPSESEWRNDPTACIRFMGATYLDMTPSVARLIDPSTLLLVRTVTLGGEPSTIKDMARWWKQCYVVNAYGPSECTANSVINFDANSPEKASHIGTGAGVSTWIVDQNDSNRLVPLGVVGELILEGPLLGYGYLNDAEQTARAFITAPPWLQKGPAISNGAGREGRLYKTGDLVKYDDAGNLVYMGRKDRQVKIRGQRVELSEIETQVLACMPPSTELVAEVILPSDVSATQILVLFLSGETNGEEIDMMAIPSELERQLLDRLPIYMVPSICFTLPRLPTTITGKIDRRSLIKMGSSYLAGEFASTKSHERESGKRYPTTDRERTLQRLWATTLDIDLNTIGIDDTFFHFGGDSITAMQVAFEARRLNIHISSSDILRHKTIHKLVQKASIQPEQVFQTPTETITGELFGLTPIQRLFIGMQRDIYACFDQFFMLKIQRRISLAKLYECLQYLVRRHPMLRARLRKGEDGRWQQLVLPVAESCVKLHASSQATATQDILKARSEIDIVNGPTLVSVLVENNDGQGLFMSMHHFFFDLVSWRVLLQELEARLLDRELSEMPLSASFQSWQKIQVEYASRQLSVSTSDRIFEMLSQPSVDYWGMAKKIVLLGTVAVKEFTVDDMTTRALLDNCNSTFQTRPVELMIAVLMYSFCRCFQDRDCLTVFNEIHGRDTELDNVELSRTLGWFTSIVPVRLMDQTDMSSIFEVIRATKDHMRGLEKMSWSHFASQFRDEDISDRTVSRFPVELTFNYVGLYQQLEREGSLFRMATLPNNGYDPSSVCRVSRFALIDVEIGVSNGQATVAFAYDRRMDHQDRIENWIRLYEKTLNNLPRVLSETPNQWTLDDFPLAFTNYKDLADFQEIVLPRLNLLQSEIEDVYPCSPMQQGILHSQSKSPSLYRSCTVMEVVSKKGVVSIPLLEGAWRAVVRRHSILRTILAEDIPGSPKAFNVVLKEPEVSISVFDTSEDVVNASNFRRQYDPAKRQSQGPPHHFAISRLDNGRVFFCLEINHAITDAHSQNLMMRDLQFSYDNEVLPPGSPYQNFIRFLGYQDIDAAYRYWNQYLEGCEPCFFPKINQDGDGDLIETLNVPNVSYDAIRIFCSQYDCTVATVLQVAWAIVVGRYSGTTMPCFGTLLSGRDHQVSGVNEIAGPLINMLVSRVKITEQTTVLEALKTLQDEYLASLPYQTFSIAEVHRALELGSTALFNTQISFVRTPDDTINSDPTISFIEHDDLDPTEYDIIIRATQSKETIRIALDFRSSHLSRNQAGDLASCLSKCIHEIITKPTALLEHLDITTEKQLDRFWHWNATAPEAIKHCLHELVTVQAQIRPRAKAIHAWDGDLSYGVVDAIASKFARTLISMGLEPDSIVPLCFEKSKWTVVAILAILKAGGAICMLDPNHPIKRLRSIVEQTKATIVVTSRQYKELGSRIAPNAISLEPKTVNVFEETDFVALPKVTPLAMMYVGFSSGSTGSPKGAIISHSSYCTGIHYQTSLLKITPESRLFDFSHHVFDVYIHQVGITLANGACLCVPSDEDRKDNLAKTMNSMAVTHVILTPTVSRLIEPEAVSSLQCIALCGEPCSLADAERWLKKTMFVNVYAPSECTAHAVWNCNPSNAQKALAIGKGSGVVTWIVDPKDHSMLVPPGAVGELILEGPLVGNGYLGNPQKSAKAFIQSPDWLLKGSINHPGRYNKLFKTGDLVRYLDDGNIFYIGRKDTQIKIRGQLVELGEVEHHVRACWKQASESTQLAVEVISPRGKGSKPLLALFLSSKSGAFPGAMPRIDGNEGIISKIPAIIENSLLERLPTYMVPTICFILPHLPTTSTDKTYRKGLRELGGSYSTQELAHFCLENDLTKRRPSTEIEKALHQIWAKVLTIEADSIGIDDSFFRLGGDSMSAMQVSFEARLQNLAISTTDILKNKTIESISCLLYKKTKSDGIVGDASNITIKRPLGLTHYDHLDEFKHGLLPELGLKSEDIDDIYPSSPFQEGIWISQAKNPNDYHSYFIYQVLGLINITQLQEAWGIVVHRHPILRTIFTDKIPGSSRLFNIVLRRVSPEISMIHQNNNEIKIEAIRLQYRPLKPGQRKPMHHFSICQLPNQTTFITLDINHMLVDGYSQQLIIQDLKAAYENRAMAPVPLFKDFIYYLEQQNRDESQMFWHQRLRGVEPCIFSDLAAGKTHRDDQQVVQHRTIDTNIINTFCREYEITPAILIQAGWSLVLRQYTRTSNVCFGLLSLGRDIPITNATEIVGPLVSMVTCRVDINGDFKVRELLSNIQHDYMNSLQHQFFPLADIHRDLQLGSSRLFNTAISFLKEEPPTTRDQSTISFLNSQSDGSTEYDISIYATQSPSQLAIELVSKTQSVTEPQACEVADYLTHAIQAMIAHPESTIQELLIPVPFLQNRIWKWNCEVPKSSSKCVHDLIEQQSNQTPNAPAIRAWDGEMTYRELNHAATVLACYLAEIGVNCGDIVPLCFEKSIWTTVSLLGVLKAGAAFVMLEPQYPESRLKSIIHQTNATFILASLSAFDRISRLAQRVVTVGAPLITALKEQKVRLDLLPNFDLSSRMYIAFTSGSTGVPKGAMVSHSCFSSALLHQTSKLEFKSTSRVLDATPYAFDLWIHCTGATLSTGGCLCVPMEADRKNDLTSCIRSMGATYTLVTPSLSRFIQPDKTPSLEVLALCGELPTVADIDRWKGHARIINTYGPAECTPITLINATAKTPQDATKIGNGAGVNTWIVDQHNDSQLITATGIAGELLLEGPLVGDGYLGCPEATSNAFLHNPSWLVKGTFGRPGRCGKVYKTGDLVCYDENGALIYLGRKDNQVKIKGQRVELGEVEHHVSKCLPRVTQLVAELITPGGGNLDPRLAIFISLGGLEPTDLGVQLLHAQEHLSLVTISPDMEDYLARQLPTHMIPAVYFALSHLPNTMSEKIDRKRLRKLGESYSSQQLASLQIYDHGLMPSTDEERTLQKLWASVLQIDCETVGKNDSFFRLGGDSIAAMRLVAAAREANIQLLLSDIFQHPRLASLVDYMTTKVDITQEIIPKFSLVGGQANILKSIHLTLKGYGLAPQQVDDVLPCTPLQEGLMVLSSKHPAEYTRQFVLKILPHVDLEAFRKAWEIATHMTEVLRTRIIYTEDYGSLQIILKDGFNWVEEAGSLDRFLKIDLKDRMAYGKQLNHYSLINDLSGGNWLVWTIHHALYDGMSLSILTTLVRRIYESQKIEPFCEYRCFIKYLQDRDISMDGPFWRSTFEGYQYSQFPSMSSPTKVPRTYSEIKQRCYFSSCKTPDITLATVVRGSWALVVSSRIGTSDIVFGTTVSGRSAPVTGIESIIGPTIATVPTRIQIRAHQTVSSYLQTIQAWMTDLIPHEQTGLQQIRKFSSETEQACRFETLLVIHSAEDALDGEEGLWEWGNDTNDQGLASYGLVINCYLDEGGAVITFTYDSTIQGPRIMKSLIDQFCQVIEVMAIASPDLPLGSLDVITSADKSLIWNWNERVPSKLNTCIHEMIEEQVRERPDKIAVHAWDGAFTYKELSAAATNLACHLSSLGVGPGTIVPLCLEKSKWTTVAMLAVWKAGAASCMLEAAHPESRLKTIVQQLSAKVMLTSPIHRALSSRLAENIVTVGPAVIYEANEAKVQHLPPPNPSATMYLIFTSGSTGLPKGALVSHASFCSGVFYQAEKLGFNSQSRVLDLASYAFDMPIHMTGAALATGGCICVPSEMEKKNNLMNAIITYESTIFAITPSLARLVEPEAIPSIKSVILGGEPLALQDAERWTDFASLSNAYGPSECTPVSVINHNTQNPALATRIGRGEGVVTWLVDPDTPDKLVPIGAVGELLIEGPLLGSGYLNDPEKTAATYIEDPTWLVQGTETHEGRRGRLYKTGDLARYHEDGSLSYVGRKDTQAKIRGQRIELAEVEYYLRTCMPEANQLAAEVIEPSGHDSSSLLAAFTSFPGKEKDSIEVLSLPVITKQLMRKNLPDFMIPSVCFIMQELPTTTSHKIDRKRLRELGATYSAQKLANICTFSLGGKKPPSTDKEKKLQDLWAQVLNIELSTIGATDSFLALGGDSISAMKLVTRAREAELSITVANVFENPRLCDLAEYAIEQLPESLQEISPFSLVGDKKEVLANLSSIFDTHGIDSNLIEDIYPCTPLQEGLLALTAKRSASYVLQSVLDLDNSVNIDRFRHAWAQTISQCAILRTKIVYHKTYGLLQVITKDDIHWGKTTSQQEYLEKGSDGLFGLGKPLCQYCLVEDPHSGQGKFILTLHHAAYDAVSLRLIIDLLERIYRGSQQEKQTNFNHFIQYLQLQNKQESRVFWEAEFDGYQASQFPPLPLSTPEPTADSTLEHFCPLSKPNASGITVATIIQAAWAIVAAIHTGIPDVTFGTTVSGRSAPVPGINSMASPTISTIPLRIKVNRELTVHQYLESVQKKMIALIPFEQTGLHEIASVSPEADQACKFQTLVVVQPENQNRASENYIELGSWCDITRSESFTSYALTLDCFLENGGVHILSRYDSNVISHKMMDQLLNQFDHLLKQLSHVNSEEALQSLDTLSETDQNLIWDWNFSVPEAVHRSWLDLVQGQVEARPSAIAVDSWDGIMTYKELDDKATDLALHLLSLNVSKNDIIPLLFEKSVWTVVAFLAVLKAGSAVCMLDPSHPKSRLEKVIRQTGAKYMLCSKGYLRQCSELGEQTIIRVDSVSSLELKESAKRKELPHIDPFSLMYVMFTSGSTGEPKASLISHTSFCSGLFYQVLQLGFSTSSRVLDAARYGFDVFNFNIGATLATGGCFCVPNESSWKDDPTKCIQSMKATHIEMVPSISRLVNPQLVPLLRTVVLGGEFVTSQDAQRWWNSAQVANVYGPSECTSHSVINVSPRNPSEASWLGKGAGSVTWIVDPDDYNILVPIGAVGELLLEGPLVGRGYLNSAEKTASSFVQDPTWLRLGTPRHAGRRGRLYKTGDLVRYNDDGNLIFVSRKDAQVKINGQRVELAEIEFHIRNHMPEASQLVVDTVKPSDDSSRTMLAVFRTLNLLSGDGVAIEALSSEIEHVLEKHLPRYMIPSICITLPRIPRTATEKIDRKRLVEIGSSYSSQQLAELGNKDHLEKRMPSTEIGIQLQKAWSHILNINMENVGLDDNFFRLGGDSIGAMKLAAAARDAGLQLSVADIFRQRTLKAIVDITVSSKNHDSTWLSPSPYALITPAEQRNILGYIKENRSCITPELIEDIVPTTSFQKDYLRLTLQRRHVSLNYFQLYLGHDVDVTQLQQTCTDVVNLNPILRTIFVPKYSISEQIVLKEMSPSFQVIATDIDIEARVNAVFRNDLQQEHQPGHSYIKFFLVSHKTLGHRLVVRISHAQYDAISLRLIIQSLLERDLQPRTLFSTYIAYTHLKSSISSSYWRKRMEGSKVVSLKPVLRSLVGAGTNVATRHVYRECSIPTPVLPHGFTLAMLVSSSWAVILSAIIAQNDVVYCQLVAGRNASIPGVQEIIGPCHNAVPVRVRLNHEQTGLELLATIQEQQLSLGEFDSTSLDTIFDNYSNWNPSTQIDSIVHHLSSSQSVGDGDLPVKWLEHENFYPSRLEVISLVEENILMLRIEGDSSYLNERVIDALLESLRSITITLSTNLNVPIKDLQDLVSI